MRLLYKFRFEILLGAMIAVYVLYFSYLTVLRYQTLYASYFDLGIMHQTVHNTYIAIKDSDYSRFLEFTDPLGHQQIKRMGFHNDIILALFAPFYFIHDSPATLLVIQTVVVALGAVAVYLISQEVFKKLKNRNTLSLLFSFSYLINPVLQRANIYDFHAVTLATSLLLFMFYFWLRGRYGFSFLFLILALTTKEQVSLTTAFFGLYAMFHNVMPNSFRDPKKILKQVQNDKANYRFSLFVIATSMVWFIGSVFFVIPYFRGGNHFALGRYSDFGDSPGQVLLGFFKNPAVVMRRIFHVDTFRYLLFLLGPLGFLSVFSPLIFLIATPEFGINLLSSSWNMRNIIYQYTAVIQPFIFISAIYGTKKLIDYSSSIIESRLTSHPRLDRGSRKVLDSRFRGNDSLRISRKISVFIASYLLMMSLLFALWKGPLPISLEKEIHPFVYPQKELYITRLWADTLKDEQLKISTTGQLSPFFTGRRYFYTFSENYPLADYIVIRLNEIYNYPEKNVLIPVYKSLTKDSRFELIFKRENFEVYKKKKHVVLSI